MDRVRARRAGRRLSVIADIARRRHVADGVAGEGLG
jgi:hypothetical protein